MKTEIIESCCGCDEAKNTTTNRFDHHGLPVCPLCNTVQG